MERHLLFKYKPDAVWKKHWGPGRKLLISLHCFAIWFLRQVLMELCGNWNSPYSPDCPHVIQAELKLTVARILGLRHDTQLGDGF